MNTDVNNVPKFNIGDEVFFYDYHKDIIHKVVINEITIRMDGVFCHIGYKEYDYNTDGIREYCLEANIQDLVHNLKERAKVNYFDQCETFDKAVRKYFCNQWEMQTMGDNN